MKIEKSTYYLIRNTLTLFGEEIDKLKKKYSTDLRDFEIIEVKNGKDNI